MLFVYLLLLPVFWPVFLLCLLVQRQTWLREALSQVCKGQMEEVEQIKQCLTVLRKENLGDQDENGEEMRDGDDEDERESAFEMLSDLCENLDNARGLWRSSRTSKVWADLIPGVIETSFWIDFCFHRSDGAWWARVVRLPVFVSRPEWAEVACCWSCCLLCSEHATDSGPPAQYWDSPKAASTNRFRPGPHRQGQSTLCCLM